MVGVKGVGWWSRSGGSQGVGWCGSRDGSGLGLGAREWGSRVGVVWVKG